jgi:hypothetical protein
MCLFLIPVICFGVKATAGRDLQWARALDPRAFDPADGLQFVMLLREFAG